mmetsp:Transcript_11293/g.42149  ORF Transcript_11293/g.42149 Transcript_11293/m.42149 type:complete len:326 (+) Transcript_11293:2420-3397(+)
MAGAQGRVLWQDDLHLHEELRTEVVRSDNVTIEGVVVTVHNVSDLLEELRIRRSADDHLDLLPARLHPAVDDVERDHNGAHRINPPVPSPVVHGRGHGSHKRDAIAEDVVEVVLRDCRDRLAFRCLGDPAAPHVHDCLDEDRAADDDVGDQGRLRHRRVARRILQVHDNLRRRFSKHLERRCRHQCGADDHSHGLQTTPPGRKVLVDPLRADLVGAVQNHLGQQIQERVHHGGQDRQTARYVGCEDFEQQQQHVGGDAEVQGPVDGLPRGNAALQGEAMQGVRVAEGAAVEVGLHKATVARERLHHEKSLLLRIGFHGGHESLRL